MEEIMENEKFEIGFIGLGRMGKNMVTRILNSEQIKVLAWNRSDGPKKDVQKLGAITPDTIEELINSLKQKRKVVWLMLPSGDITQSYFDKILSLLNPNDILIDGGNSYFRDTLKRFEKAKEKGVKMMDIGVSGGIVAAKRGYPMMIGGDKTDYEYCLPLFKSFGIEKGFDHVGPNGAGHFVKMVHNAIEYGMMEAITEGFHLLKDGPFENLDLSNISSIWNHGTIISSFLIEMAVNALNEDQSLKTLKPFVSDSGEGRWAVKEAIDAGVPFEVNSTAVFTRFRSQISESNYSNKLLAAIRNQFGGHAVKKEDI
jgi:6-phosphogluconate dehydrogenase